MTIQLTELEKSEIKALLSVGKKQSDLAEKYKVNQSTISRLATKIKEKGNVERQVGSGRRKSLDKYDLEYMEKIIKINPRIGSTKLAENLLKDRNKKVCPSSVRSYLTKIGLKGRIACPKPHLTKRHIKARLDWASDKYNWDDEDWKRVIWSDETKINLFGSDGKQYVRRRDGTRYDLKNLTPTVKHGGGGIMVWACFSYEGVGELYVIKGTMDRFLYTRILTACLKKSANNFNLDDFIFQQDNASTHTCKHTTDWFLKNDIDVMDWPAQSPDLNPIENLWYVFKVNVSKRNPKNLNELEQYCKEEWKKLDPELIKRLVLSMKNRCREVLDAKGGHTSY